VRGQVERPQKGRFQPRNEDLLGHPSLSLSRLILKRATSPTAKLNYSKNSSTVLVELADAPVKDDECHQALVAQVQRWRIAGVRCTRRTPGLPAKPLKAA
jgi:hypothetical protein